MMSKVIWSAFLFLTFVFPASSQETGQRVPFTTIEQGQTSNVSDGDATLTRADALARAEALILDLTTADAVIRDVETWTRVWHAYTRDREPRPELPYVDFNAEMIIASSRGEVSDLYVDRNQGILHVVAGEIQRSGITNPFHIIKTRRSEFQSVVLHHPVIGKVRVSDGTDTGDVQMQEEDVQTQDIRPEAVAPDCVILGRRERRGIWFWQRATNNCDYNVRLRFIWARVVDGQCVTLFANGDWHEEGRLVTYNPVVSELRLC